MINGNAGESARSVTHNVYLTVSQARTRRSLDENLADDVVGAVALTGIRYALRTDDLFFRIIGQQPDGERKRFQELIDDLKDNVTALENAFTNVTITKLERNLNISRIIDENRKAHRHEIDTILDEIQDQLQLDEVL